MTLAGPLPQSYVYLQATGRAFEPAPGRRALYDAATSQLLLVGPASIAAYHVLKPALPRQDIDIEQGAPVLTALASLDGRLLALQRGGAHLELVHRQTGNLFVQGPWKGKSALLGFFWTQAASCDLVMVTPSGLELYEVGERATSLRYGGKLSQPVKWWRYAHDTRLVILGTGELGLWLQAYQFTSDGVMKLAPFQIGASTPSAQPAPPAASVLDPADITLLTAYQRVYCAYCDRPARRLLLYRFYKDAVILQHTYDLPAPDVRLAVSDNLLLVHSLATAAVVLLDVCNPGSAPVAAPLPLAIGPPVPPAASGKAGKGAGPESEEGSSAAGEVAQRLLHETTSLRFEMPNTVLDMTAGIAYRCQVDVEALSRACGDWPALVAVLQQRRPSAHPGANLWALTLAALREVLAERVALPAARRVFDAAVAPLAAAALSNGSPASPGSMRRRVMVTPAAMVDEVFRWLHDEEAVDAPYLQAAIGEYEAAAAARGVGVPESLFRLALEIALQQGPTYATLSALATQPALASTQVAARLEAATERGELDVGEGQQLAANMRTRLGLHAQRCADLLAQGEVVRALRVALRHRVDSIPPVSFLQAAAWNGNPGVFAAVYRFCCDTVQPRLPDYDTIRQEYNHFFPNMRGVAAA